MANEAILVFRTAHPIPFTVSNSVGIEKGTVCQLTDPFTASVVSATGQAIAGIAASEKIASDGKVKLGMYRQGVFKMYLSGACIVGDNVVNSATVNYVQKSAVGISGSRVIGTALETGAAGETILVDVNIGMNGRE